MITTKDARVIHTTGRNGEKVIIVIIEKVVRS